MRPRILAGLVLAAFGPLGPALSSATDDPPREQKPEARREDDDPSAFVFTPDEAIELFEYRAKLNPRDYISLATLGDLYERKARDSDDLAAFEKAEAALRKALEVLPNYARAKSSLAVVLCDRHKFAEGLAMAREVLKADPRDLEALVTIGDAQVELGRYAEAESAFREVLAKLSDSPRHPAAPVLGRIARIEELKGHTDEALRWLRRAEDSLEKPGPAAPDKRAWYEVRRADVLFDAGRLDEAEALYEAVLKGVPKQHDATFGLGRALAARGKLDEAIGLVARAVAIGPDPHMLAALGDLCLAAGRSEPAEAAFDRLDRATRDHPEYRRERAVFLADHGRDPAEALALAEADLGGRPDIYGYDALAWALHKNGRPEDAARAMAEALRLGTRDAKLCFHAGMIHRRLGDKAKAREYLARALEINPGFSVLRAREARAAMAELGD